MALPQKQNDALEIFSSMMTRLGESSPLGQPVVVTVRPAYLDDLPDDEPFMRC
jgi:hypothetical protein